ncbi:hypothetical protein LTR37_001750 [Vermiconidia calcicola]|uniref:Uncharacterized protein n=1 Tax=Vermiconidia calcicola TaxID=1690605 RepID=A0ACC3NV01_9PEZI|nr:hypothetical protein LTR37_001750 [Vermiconidia calcicola]
MDPVSAATGIAGLVIATGTLLEFASRYVTGVRHAKEEAQSLIDELNVLRGLLHKLEAVLITQRPDTPLFEDSSVLNCNSKVLGIKFEALCKKLESTSQSKVRSFIWPIERHDHVETIAHIRAFSRLIHFALSVDTWTLLASSSGQIGKLLAQQTESLEVLDTMGNQIDTLERTIEGQTVMLQNMRLDVERQRVLDWLADDVQEKLHDHIKRGRVPETGQWLLEHQKFMQWTEQESGSSVLWCPGDMGSGKTNLCSIVIDELRKKTYGSQIGMAFFYFTYADAPSQTMGFIVGSLVRQLLSLGPNCTVPSIVTHLSKSHGSVKDLSPKDLHTCLSKVIDELERVYLVFDAVDEADVAETLKPFLELLVRLMDSPKVRVYATGRNYNHDVRVTFNKHPTIPIRADDGDLRTFIRSRMNAANSSEFLVDNKFQAEISGQLMRSAQGLFLLPALQLQRVLQEPTRGDMEDALQDLPSSLVGILDQNIDRILRQTASRKSLGLNALMWLCNARRPLQCGELSDILSLDLSQKRSLDKKYRPSARAIVECCQGLIFLDETSETLHLVHLAVQEHLLTREFQLFGEPMARVVARACFLFLLDPEFEYGPVKHPDPLSDYHDTRIELLHFLNSHLFLGYLSLDWGWHARGWVTDHEVRSLLMRFLESPARIARSVQMSRFLSGYRKRYWSLQHVWSLSGLHVACESGLTGIACELIDTGKIDVDSASSIGTTSLISAASSNQLETMRALLDRSADPYKANWYGNALHCAAERNCLATLEELLATGVDPNARSPTNRTALSCTTDRDCVEAAEILLKHKASMHYGIPGATSKRSFLGEIAANRSINMLYMLVKGGYVSIEDRVDVSRVIGAMIGRGMSLDEARQLTQHLEDQHG